MDLYSYIRDVPDFPKKGIIFKDITTLLKKGEALRGAVDLMAKNYLNTPVGKVVGIESRGFIFAGILADRLGCGFIPVRKPGKLPAEAISEEYTLEYGSDSLEIHLDAIEPGEKVVLVDDLLATGGTALAAVQLVRKLGGEILGFECLIELEFLNGREKLAGVPLNSYLKY